MMTTMRRPLLALLCLGAIGCFPDWDLLDPSKSAATGGGGSGGVSTGGGMGGAGGSASGVGGTASGVGGSEGGGGMEPLGPWSDPVIVAELADPEDDDDPSMTADGLEVFINSHRNGNGTGADIWVAKRATRNDLWGPPEIVAELSSPNTETNHNVSPDGLTMWLLSDRDDPTASLLMYVSTRLDRDSPWSTPVVETNLESQNINDVGGVTSDGLLLLGHLNVMDVSSELVMLERAQRHRRGVGCRRSRGAAQHHHDRLRSHADRGPPVHSLRATRRDGRQARDLRGVSLRSITTRREASPGSL